MNYHHTYHAGNFADVFKHCILIMLIQSLCKKEKVFCYLDTHAGIGRYDLTSAEAQKTQEYQNGVERCFLKDACPPVVKTYQTIIQKFNGANKEKNLKHLHFYPGSPWIVKSLLRSQDRMILIELHPESALTLKDEFYHDKQVIIHHQDGYNAINAFLPPQEKRGLILIDPPFEQQDEFYNIVQAMKTASRKFPTGIYAIWYPIKDVTKTKEFYRKVKNIGFSNLLMTEFHMPVNQSSQGLSRCGMIIANAPWQFENELARMLPWLSQTLFSVKEKQYRIEWLIQPT